MDYQIEISGKENLRMCRQMYLKVLSPYVLIGLAIFIIAALRSVRYWLLSGEAVYIAYIVMYLLMSILLLLLPFGYARRVFNQRLKYYNGVLPDGRIRFGDTIVIEEVDSTQTIPYVKITKVLLMPGCIVLYLGKTKIIGFPDEVFTKGSLPELKNLMRTRCPNAKIVEIPR